ncbi:MAG: hypothetical protein ACLFV6_00555 [Spirulinaceae cyanobacterium]
MVLGFDRLWNWLKSTQGVASVSEDLQKLPASYQQDLRQSLAQLPIPEKTQTTIKNAATDAIASWQKDGSAENHLVFIDSPIEPLEDYLVTLLTDCSQFDVCRVFSFPNFTTPQQRQTQLNEALSHIPSEAEVILIPNLAQGFLRCIHGLNAITTLQTTILENRDRFWILGCPSWAWEYLHTTYQIKANLNQAIHLPSLDAGELEAWFKKVDIDILIEAEEEQTCSYFQSLAKAALGSSQVAQDLWIDSLFCPHEKAEIENAKLSVKRQTSFLPELPGLSLEDCYLLYSLLLHQTLNLDCLAVSLGTHPTSLQSQIQQLQKDKLILAENGVYRVNPHYYPHILLDLRRNKFLVP